jgi:drug/metabolite transporter (DMT)-like permease
VLLGVNQALVKLVNVGFSPVFQAGLRSACAILPVLAFALYARKRLSITDGSLAPGLLNGLLFSGEFCLLFLALDYTTVARASLFFYTMPVWLAVAAHFLLPGERLTLRKAAGLTLAIVGVTVAFSGRSEASTQTSWIGDVLALAAALCWASIALLTRLSRLQDTSPQMNLLYQLVVSALVLLLIAPFFGDQVREPTATILGIFAFQVIVIVAIGFTIWFWLLSVYPASNIASFSLLAPLFGVLSGWLIFHDPLTPVFLAALGLVMAGLVVANSRASPPVDPAAGHAQPDAPEPHKPD